MSWSLSTSGHTESAEEEYAIARSLHAAAVEGNATSFAFYGSHGNYDLTSVFDPPPAEDTPPAEEPAPPEPEIVHPQQTAPQHQPAPEDIGTSSEPVGATTEPESEVTTE